MKLDHSLKLMLSLSLVTTPFAYAAPDQVATINPRAPLGLDSAGSEEFSQFISEFRALPLDAKIKAAQSLKSQVDQLQSELDEQIARRKMSHLVGDNDQSIELSASAIKTGASIFAATAAIGFAASGTLRALESNAFLNIFKTDASREAYKVRVWSIRGGDVGIAAARMGTAFLVLGGVIFMIGIAGRLASSQNVTMKQAEELAEATRANAAKLERLTAKYRALDNALR